MSRISLVGEDDRVLDLAAAPACSARRSRCRGRRRRSPAGRRRRSPPARAPASRSARPPRRSAPAPRCGSPGRSPSRPPCAVLGASSASRTMRLASSMSSSLPVSFHQPRTMCGWTSRPRSIRSWMASVISSSPRGGRLDPVDRLEDGGVEHVDADQRQVALRLLGLLDQAPDLAFVGQLGDAELLGVRHLGEQDLGVAAQGAELVHQAGDAAGDQVVAQVHDERRAGQELLGDHDRVSEAAAGPPARCR